MEDVNKEFSEQYPLFISGYPINIESYTSILSAYKIQTVISFVGTGYAEPLPFLENDSIDEMLKGNFLFNLDMIKKSLNSIKHTGGNIVVTNSIAGIIPQEGSSVYTATKFALRGLIESLRKEIKPYQIGLSSLYFQNVTHVGIQPILDCVLTSIKNKTINFDFVIN